MPNIKGVKFIKGPIESTGEYDLYTGFIVNDKDSDIPHYLIVHRENEVVEASSAHLPRAREAMVELNKMLVKTQTPDLDNEEQSDFLPN